MRDFYEVLEVERNASQTQIKAAFKRLAMVYHPDRNPGNREAEETFKLINEAYHTLSDPVKKLRYDSRFEWVRNEDQTFDEAYWQELKRRRYERWREAQEKHYRFDKNYFKIQGLAFLVFIIMAGVCFGIIHTASYYVQLKNAEKWNATSALLNQVNGLFGQGRFDDAFAMIHIFEEKDPAEYRFIYAKDSLVNALRHLSDDAFNRKDFAAASKHYAVLKKYEHPVRFETLQNISMCEYYLGNFKESLVALKHLHNQEPDNLNLIYQIGYINLEKLNNTEEALTYLTLGKKLFKSNLSSIYGKAFEIVMDPNDAPDIYFHILYARAEANMRLKKYKDAVIDYNWSIFLRPHLGEPYHQRALANIKQKKYRDVCDDLTKAISLDIRDAQELHQKHCVK